MLRGRRVSSLTIRLEGKIWRKDSCENGSSLSCSFRRILAWIPTVELYLIVTIKAVSSHRMLSHHLDLLNIPGS